VTDPLGHPQRRDQSEQASRHHQRHTPGRDVVRELAGLEQDAVCGELQKRCGDQSERHRDGRHEQREVQRPEGELEHHVEHRCPGAPVREPPLDAGEQPCVRSPRHDARTPWHADSQQPLDHAALDKRDRAYHREREQRDGYADDQDQSTHGHRNAGHHDREVDDARGEGEQHVEEPAPGTRIGDDAEEARQRVGRAGRCRLGRAQCGANRQLRVAVRSRDLVGSAVRVGGRLERGDRIAALLGDGVAQVLLGIVEGVLYQRGVGACERRLQLREVALDRPIQRSPPKSYR